jgi:hypothetical protein
MTRHRGRRALVVIVAAVALACSACGWMDVAANPLHTGFNAAERSVRSDDWTTLHQVWTAQVEPASTTKTPSSVAVSGNRVFILSDAGQLQAYAADGSTSCSGTPTVCDPLWTASAGGASTLPVTTDPATDGTTVFIGGADGTLYAFDAAGQTDCSGTPTVCSPLWTASLGSSALDPVVADGRVFVGTSGGMLDAFDATGTTNCTGTTPRTCAPLWQAAAPDEYGGIGNLPAPAVTSSFVYYPVGNALDAFDAAGQHGCSGTPVNCTPVWTGDVGTAATAGWPVVSGNVVYQAAGANPSDVFAFDAAGVHGCAGTPTTCAPLWTDQTKSSFAVTPAIGPDGNLYAGFSELDEFSTDRITGCSGTPVVCNPLHTASLNNGLTLAPSLADDVVVLGVFQFNTNGLIEAFQQGTLAPLGSFALGPPNLNQFPGLLAISNGKVFESTSNGDLQAWATNG